MVLSIDRSKILQFHVSDRISRAQFDSERQVKELIDTSEFNEEDEKGIDVPFFDLQSILEATDNFSDANKLGQGGYGPVYKVIEEYLFIISYQLNHCNTYFLLS